ncbi:molybdopterin-guanine dinucleotide biosynthesis protein B [Priestia koreensis]|uniref:molybdopterin-guanine dinucleotide biosynthesis protein B n=1 Tax=Priestia koreensis TaxID=284581 RepID=UPI00345A47B4
MNILQVVGYKNTGKTTVVEKIVGYLSLRYQVSSLKHHGHGGAPDLHQTDSSRHFEAGAIASGVEGDGVFYMQTNDIKVEKMLQIYELLGAEVCVIEGYKHVPYPKIVIVRNPQDYELLKKLENIHLVLTWNEEDLFKDKFLHVNDEERLREWIDDFMGGTYEH